MTSTNKLILAGIACAVFIYLGLSMGGQPTPAKNSAALYQQRDFNDGSVGRLNISVYTFRDRDADGEFGVNDAPLAGIAVQLTRPDGREITHRSNINGFANFSMSLGNDSANISEPSTEYRFKTIAPPGWQITNDNTEQLLEARALTGSYAGIIFTPAPKWVGLTPSDPEETPATSGTNQGHHVESFDAITDRSLAKIPTGHLGLAWDYLIATDSHLYNSPGMANNLISGNYIAYNSSGHPVTITSAEGRYFDFIGGYFGVAWSRAEGEELRLTGWRDGRVQFEQNFALSHLKARWLQANWQQIDKLELKSEHYWQFTLDDLHLVLPSEAPEVAD